MKQMSPENKLLIFIFAIVLWLGAIFSWIAYKSVKKNVADSFHMSAESLLDNYENSIATYMENNIAALSDLAGSPEVVDFVMQSSVDATSLTSRLNQQRHLGNAANFSIYDFTGEAILNTEHNEASLIDDKWLTAVLSGEIKYKVLSAKDKDRHMIIYAVPIIYNNGIEGVLATFFPSNIGLPLKNLDFGNTYKVNITFGGEVIESYGNDVESNTFELMSKSILDTSIRLDLITNNNILEKNQRELFFDITIALGLSLIISLFIFRKFGVNYLVRPQRELMIRNEELIVLRDRALTAEKAKSSFLANMSHEIRTPMNGVLGMIQLLSETKLTPEQKDMVETTRSCGNGLMSILNDILDISKIESGKVDLEIVNFNLNKCIEEALYLNSFKASQKGVNLIYDRIEESTSWLKGDITRIRQIIVNYLSNAIKFTSDGEVTVIVNIDDLDNGRKKIKLGVKDTGVGIPEEAQPRLFQAFTQADSSTTRLFGGTGLGLSICAKLATLMSGKVSFESELGVGSTFFLEIELESGVIEDNSLDSDFRNSIEECEMAKVFPHKILVVEDNAINQKLVRMMLKKFGYSCDIAQNGLEALEALKREQGGAYSIVFMDMQMPEMDGVTATVKIIEKYGEKAPPIIAMTANAFEEDRKKCREAGMVDFIAKPISAKSLKKVLGTYIDFNRAMANNSLSSKKAS